MADHSNVQASSNQSGGDAAAFYRHVLQLLDDGGVDVLIGGTFAYAWT